MCTVPQGEFRRLLCYGEALKFVKVHMHMPQPPFARFSYVFPSSRIFDTLVSTVVQCGKNAVILRVRSDYHIHNEANDIGRSMVVNWTSAKSMERFGFTDESEGFEKEKRNV